MPLRVRFESSGQAEAAEALRTRVVDIWESDERYRERLRDWALWTNDDANPYLFQEVSRALDRSVNSMLDSWAEHNSSAPRRLTLTIRKDDIVQTAEGTIWRVTDFAEASQTVFLMPFRQGNQRTLLGGDSVQPAENLLGSSIVKRSPIVEHPIAAETPKSPALTVWERLSEEDEEIH